MGFLGRLFGLRPKSEDADYELVPSQFETGSGFVVRRLADGQRLSWRTLPHREGIEAANVVGVSHHMKALQHSTFAPGKPLTLVPEPDNPHDPHAIGVWNAGKTKQAGYLPKSLAKEISQELAPHGPDDEKIGCLAMWENRKNRERVGLRLLIVRSHARVRGVQF